MVSATISFNIDRIHRVKLLYLPCLPTKFIDECDLPPPKFSQLNYKKHRTIILDNELFPRPEQLIGQHFEYLTMVPDGKFKGSFKFLNLDSPFMMEVSFRGMEMTLQLSSDRVDCEVCLEFLLDSYELMLDH